MKITLIVLSFFLISFEATASCISNNIENYTVFANNNELLKKEEFIKYIDINLKEKYCQEAYKKYIIFLEVTSVYILENHFTTAKIGLLPRSSKISSKAHPFNLFPSRTKGAASADFSLIKSANNAVYEAVMDLNIDWVWYYPEVRRNHEKQNVWINSKK